MISETNFFNNKIILITGGTGSFGNTFVEKLVAEYHVKQIIVFSRDEKKQYDMRNRYIGCSFLKFVIGDVRDRRSVENVMKNVDFVFHAAALKQVPSCEFFPYEAVKTNIIGTQNVLDTAEKCNVKKVVILSTDKAVYPINAMGMTKAIMEKLMLAKARASYSSTVFCGIRYGNVLFSRGSVLPLFIEQIKNKKPLTITNEEMTRYLLPLPIAIELVLFALKEGENGDIFVRKSPSATIKNLADAIINIYNYDRGIKVIGIRGGEKMHETLVSQEELMRAVEYDNYFKIKDIGQINYDKFFSEGEISPYHKEGYTSHNAERLSLDETKKLILSLKEFFYED